MTPQEQRAQVIAALACVNYVTFFSEATPLDLITYLRSDILVKGGDYTTETVVGREVVEAYGRQVCLMPYLPGVSTTGILHSITTPQA